MAADRVQGGLFDRPDDARSIRRMRAIDQLNARFGRGTVGFGTAGERHAWKPAAGIHIATLHDGVGRAAAGVGEGRGQRCAAREKLAAMFESRYNSPTNAGGDDENDIGRCNSLRGLRPNP
jgi:hypothetical protein